MNARPAPPRRIFILIVIATAVARAAEAVAAEQLGPASFSERVDTQGFRWQIAQNGGLTSDQRGCISNAFMPTFGSTQINFPQQQMTADGMTYVFSGAQFQQLTMSRRVQFDFKQSLVQYVDTFRNTSTQPFTASLTLHHQLGNPAQAAVNEQGLPLMQNSVTKVGGIITVAQNGVPSALFYLGSAKGKVQATVNNQGNYRFTVSYTVPVPAGKTVSLAYGMLQSNLAAVPDAKTAAALMKPFAATTWSRAIPSELKSSIANGGGTGYGAGDAIDLLNSPDALAELGVERGPHDMLLAGDETRLRGTLSCGPVSIDTKRGPKKLPPERIAAFFGGNQRGRTTRVVLRDGQVLVGPLDIPALKFTLNSGLDVTCETASLDRFVMKERPDDGKPAADVFAYVDSLEGDRLAVKQGDRQTVTALTQWGECEVGLDEIEVWSAGNAMQGRIAHRIILRDGSSFSAMVSDGTLQLATVEYGVQHWSVFDVRRWRSAHRSGAKTERIEPSAPHALVMGDNLFVGPVDLPLLHLAVQGQVVPIPPTQLKVLRREDEAAPGSDSLTFRIEMWDGDVAVGSLVETQIPIRTVGGVIQVPTTDLLELRVPTPTVPDSLRARITELLADLGHAEWTRREAASKELRSLGGVIKEQCEDVMKGSSDQEVRKRVQALLDAVKE